MKTRLLTIAALLGSSFASYAMDEYSYSIPKAEILTERLCDRGMDHFVDHTTIVGKLAGKSELPLTVVLVVDDAITEYAQWMMNNAEASPNVDEAVVNAIADFFASEENPGPYPMERLLETQKAENKSALLRACLEDHPEALKKLEEAGLYNHNE